jgi:hypothetical protein
MGICSVLDGKDDVQRVYTWPNYIRNHVEWSHVAPSLLHPSHLKPSLLAAFQGDGPGWSTQEDSTVALHICEQMPDNLCEHLSFTFLLISFLVEHSFNILSI